MHVSALHVYPVKSAAGLALDRAELDDRGILHDRAFMFVNAKGEFLTQREHPRMALIRTTLTKDTLQLDAPDLPSISLPLERSHLAPQMRVKVWSDSCLASVASDDANAWATAFFGEVAHLVCMPQTTKRRVDTRYVSENRNVRFADGFPLLVTNQASLEALNARLARPISMSRFRPNIVIAGGSAFEEDGWRRLQVGELILECVKPCSRCVIVNIDPESSFSRPEPLAALAAIHRVRNRVLFGQNALNDKPGVIAVGDQVRLLD
ncbi:MAG: MOSC domain-containing protein [Sandaracinaceae bacterium]|jgi:uncharacterized protein YcbX|nr:MOSC domain-containing protein [Sandaracinaceae bacterium]